MQYHVQILTELPKYEVGGIGWLCIRSTPDYEEAESLAKLYPFAEIVSVGLHGSAVVASHMIDAATPKEK